MTKVIVINKEKLEWAFNSVRKAKPHLKKDSFYHEEIRDREKVRVYDDKDRV